MEFTKQEIIDGLNGVYDKKLKTDDEIITQIKRLIVDGKLTEDDIRSLVDRIKPPTIDEDGNATYFELYTLDDIKTLKIAESKTKLEQYLADNPYLFTDEKYYTCTKEKQNLLANAILVYKMEVEAGNTSAVFTWNATGEECTERTIEEGIALAIGMAGYVKPLVSKQQEYEINASVCTTSDELDAIIIDYSV